MNSCGKSVYQPKIEDVYIVSVNNQSFTTWKITHIDNSKIWYVVNDYNVSEKYLIDSINYEENYTDTPKSIGKNEFLKIHDKNLIETPKK